MTVANTPEPVNAMSPGIVGWGRIPLTVINSPLPGLTAAVKPMTANAMSLSTARWVPIPLIAVAVVVAAKGMASK